MTPRTRTSIALYLILVFGSGVLVGVASNRLYSATTASAKNPRQSFVEFRKIYLEGMRDSVGATPEQVTEISRILDDTKKKEDEFVAQEKPIQNKIQQDHIDEIKELLNPQQRVAYDNWRAARALAKAQSQHKSTTH
jgi:uncharacterized protein YnzC (UPF0291/DUF896 family)